MTRTCDMLVYRHELGGAVRCQDEAPWVYGDEEGGIRLCDLHARGFETLLRHVREHRET